MREAIGVVFVDSIQVQEPGVGAIVKLAPPLHALRM